MKTIFTLSLLAFAACFAAAQNPIVTTNLHNYGYVNGTNTGNVYYETNVTIPKQRLILHSGGITNVPVAGITNSIRAKLQAQISNDWVTLQTFYISTTNATVDSVISSGGKVSIPMRVELATTNSLQIGIYRQQLQ